MKGKINQTPELHGYLRTCLSGICQNWLYSKSLSQEPTLLQNYFSNSKYIRI